MVRLTEWEHDREQLWLRALEEYPGGLTQRQLAAIVGLHPGHVSRRLARARRLRASPEELAAMEWLETPNPFKTRGCERHNEITIGDVKGCLACGLTGMDHTTPFRGVTPIVEVKLQKELPPLAERLHGKAKKSKG